jgi:DNA-binding NarL/FixJ family response regulator
MQPLKTGITLTPHSQPEVHTLSRSDGSISPPMRTPVPAIVQLTARERDVLGLLAQGLRNAEIAKRLFLTDSTVKHYVANLFDKIGVTNRVEAVVMAYESGFIAPNARANEGGA